MADSHTEKPDASASHPPDFNIEEFDPESSRGRLVLAAVKEFAARGVQGGRMEAIAKSASVNKALAYRYFQSKERLFSAALRLKFSRRYGVAERAPKEAGDALEYWYRHSADDASFLQLLHREALNPEQAVADEALRIAYYASRVEEMEERKKSAQFDSDLDTRMLLLALTALVSFPAFFPVITRLITSSGPEEPEFKARWAKFLRQVADRLAPRP